MVILIFAGGQLFLPSKISYKVVERELERTAIPGRTCTQAPMEAVSATAEALMQQGQDEPAMGRLQRVVCGITSWF